MDIPEDVRKEMQRQGMSEEAYEWIIAKDYNQGDIIGDMWVDEVDCLVAEPPFTFWWNRDDIKDPAWVCELKRDGKTYAKYPFNERLEFSGAKIQESAFWNDTSFGIKFSQPVKCVYTQGLSRLRNLNCSI